MFATLCIPVAETIVREGSVCKSLETVIHTSNLNTPPRDTAERRSHSFPGQ